MPATPYVEVGAVLGRVGMPDDDGIVGMAAVLQEGIPAAALLAHVVQYEVGRTVIDPGIDGEDVGARLPPSRADAEEIGARALQAAEIQPAGGLHPAHLPGGLHCVRDQFHLAGESVYDLEGGHGDGIVVHVYGHLRGLGQVADLVDADPGAGMGPYGKTTRRSGGEDQSEQCFHFSMRLIRGSVLPG